jgi:hypothetical protein
MTTLRSYSSSCLGFSVPQTRPSGNKTRLLVFIDESLKPGDK